MTKREILFEGMSEDEILDLSPQEIDDLILIDEPIVFRAGSATVLGSFKLEGNRIFIELAQIDGGGEGVLIALSTLVRSIAKSRGLSEVEWLVHAVSCAKPNPKLRHVLERRGFEVKELPTVGAIYHLIEDCD